MPRSHRLAIGTLVALLAASSAFGQRSNTQTPPPAPPSDPPVVSIPLGPNDRTEYVIPKGVVRSGAPEQELVRALAQASGCRVGWLSKSDSLILTGTPEQLALATATLATLTENAQAASDRRQADHKAQVEAERLKAEAKAKSDAASKALFDLDFPGGSVREYFAAIAAQTGFTGFVMQGASRFDELPMPNVTLRDTDLRTAVELVKKVQFPADGVAPERNLDIEWVGKATQSGQPYLPSEFESLLRSACIVRLDVYPQQPTRGAKPIAPVVLERAALDLSMLKSGGDSNVQAILDAITLAIEIDGPSERFVAKFHEPSHLLIVRGTGPEVGIVREIVQTCLARAKTALRREAEAEVASAEKRVLEISRKFQTGVGQDEAEKLRAEQQELLDRIKALRNPS